MLAKRVSLSGTGTFKCLAVVIGLFVAVTASLVVKSQADDDSIAPQAILNIDLAVGGSANVQVFGAAADDHLTGNGLPDTFTDLRRAKALAVGDFNADGTQDLVIGAPNASPVVGAAPARSAAGAVYVIFGRTSPVVFPTFIDTLNAIPGANSPSITIVGAVAGDALGFSVAVGDVNGDTFDDLVLGAPGANFPGVASTPRATPIADTGAVYVLLGSATQPPRTIDLATANAADAVIYGIDSNDLFGDAVAVGNAGGLSASSSAEQAIRDILIGAPANKGPAPVATPRADGGAAFLVFGRTTLGKVAGATLVIDLGNAGTPANVVVFGFAGDMLGSTVAIADLDATAPGDLVVGATGTDRSAFGPVLAADNTGGVYLFFGGTNLNPLAGATRTFDVSLATVNQRPSVTIYGRDADDHAGAALAVGDVTGDSVADLIIGAPDADGPGTTVRTNSGEAYVIGGSAALTPDTAQVERRIDIILPGTFLKLTVFGNAAADRLGSSVATGSFNVTGNIDGIPDLILGSPGALTNRGSVSVLFGGTALTLLATRDLNIGQDDVRVTGEAVGDEVGWGLATADLDKNRGGDLILGAPFADSPNPTRTNAGKVYFVLAANEVVPPPNQLPVVQVTAPNGAENLLGGTLVNINWTASDPNGDGTLQRFEIRLSTDSGGTFNTIVADSVAGTARTFSWTVPRINVTTARIRVTAFDTGGLSALDDSNANFTITDPGVPVDLLTPNGGESLRPGQTFQITWEVPIASVGQVKGFDLFLSTNAGASFDIAIASDPVNPKLGPAIRTFGWDIPSNLCTQTARVLVKATALNLSTSIDSSIANFSVTGPGPTVDPNDMNIGSQLKLITIQPAVGDQIRFDDEVKLEISSDAVGTQFFEFEKQKIKKNNRRFVSKGSIHEQDLSVFFPDGAIRLIRITNPPCGVTFLRVRRQGEVLVIVAAAEALTP